MSENIHVCIHIYDLIKDMSLREESVETVRCVACNMQVTVGQEMPAELLLQVLVTDFAPAN